MTTMREEEATQVVAITLTMGPIERVNAIHLRDMEPMEIPRMKLMIEISTKILS